MRKTLLHRLTAAWRQLPAGLQLSLQLFAATRALFTLYSFSSGQLIGQYTDTVRQVVPHLPSGPSGNVLLDSWTHWDSGWYLQIAQHGYTNVPNAYGQVDIAFFPLFPHLVRFLSWPFGYSRTAALVIGLVITSAGLITAGYFLYRLTKRWFNAEVAKWAVIFLYLSPMGFVLSAFMTEGLFVMLLAMSLTWAEERKWWQVMPLAFLLPLCRPTGVIVAVFLVGLYASQRGWSLRKLWHKQSLWLLAPVLGVLVLFAVNYMYTHDPIGFIHAESSWGRQLFKLEGPSGGLFTLQSIYLAMFGVSSIALLAIYRKVIGWRYLLLGVALVVVPAVSSLYGLIRYTSIILPLYVILGWLAVKHPKLQIPLVVCMAVIESVHLVWWAIGMPIMQ